MAFDQTTRNRLARFVNITRSLLAGEFTRQLQNDYGLDPNTGDVTDLTRLEYLDDSRRSTARILRDTMEHYLSPIDTSTPAKLKKAQQDVLKRIVREQAFTIFNRLCALRMAESRGLLIESIAKDYQSKGFQLYQRLAGTALGETGDCYRLFIFSVFDEFAVDLPVLFDRFSPQGRLFPREAALLNVLQEINHPDIDPLWAEDETIGWIYQYFNSVEERRQMRAESQAPRNSRELAIRNQFFTPRYVVEFLTDNTLGRIWYEMTKGESLLKESCRYLVRRPNEIFLAEGEVAPEQEDAGDDLSQEELLKQPVHILHRPLKDPRDIRMLDPACGSMHFGLYALDLFERIYEEAWEIESQRGAGGFVRTKGLKPFHESYDNKDAFMRDVPRLIIECNIHGIDIDPRAVQIAGLSLWLRAQRSWQAQNVKSLDRPQIKRSNIVCAEPMPGETDMLEEFTAQLQPKVLGQLVKIIFEKMKLAGEAGSLLKIEEEIKDAVSTAHEAYRKHLLDQKKEDGYLPGLAPKRAATLFDFSDLPQVEDFWKQAEALVLGALANYAELSQGAEFTRKRMFANEALSGFAFIDVSRRRFDVTLMNPPFGEPTQSTLDFIKDVYGERNLLAAFMLRCLELAPNGTCAAITDSTWLKKSYYIDLRTTLRDNKALPIVIADLGWGVLDSANVATCASVLEPNSSSSAIAFRLMDLDVPARDALLQGCISSLSSSIEENSQRIFYRSHRFFGKFPNIAFAYETPQTLVAAFEKWTALHEQNVEGRRGYTPGDTYRFFRCWWEVPAETRGVSWWSLNNGSPYLPLVGNRFYSARYCERWREYRPIKGFRLESESFFGRPGIGYGKRTDFMYAYPLPAQSMFSNEGHCLFVADSLRWPLIAYLNSTLCQALVNIYCGQHKTVGYVVQVPAPRLDSPQLLKAGKIAENFWKKWRDYVRHDETDEEFIGTIVPVASRDLDYLITRGSALQREYEECLNQIDDCVAESIGTTTNDLYDDLGFLISQRPSPCLYKATPILSQTELSIKQYADIVQFLVGSVLGRWSTSIASGKRPIPPCNDAHDSIPITPPAANDAVNTIAVVDMSATGLPNKIRQSLKIIFGIEDEVFEGKCCLALRAASFESYLGSDNGFFEHHLERYTKGRRHAPIYWPLSIPSGSYTLWIYYHRLTDQTLYTSVNDFVDPKLKQVSDDASSLRNKSSRSSIEEKELERLSDLELELKDFRDELLRIARFWKPNLNDGVQITAAPLWNLFQHRQWKTRLKKTWDKLEAGEYDWAHLALSIWPDRVVRARPIRIEATPSLTISKTGSGMKSRSRRSAVAAG